MRKNFFLPSKMFLAVTKYFFSTDQITFLEQKCFSQIKITSPVSNIFFIVQKFFKRKKNEFFV